MRRSPGLTSFEPGVTHDSIYGLIPSTFDPSARAMLGLILDEYEVEGRLDTRTMAIFVHLVLLLKEAWTSS